VTHRRQLRQCSGRPAVIRRNTARRAPCGPRAGVPKRLLRRGWAQTAAPRRSVWGSLRIARARVPPGTNCAGRGAPTGAPPDLCKDPLRSVRATARVALVRARSLLSTLASDLTDGVPDPQVQALALSDLRTLATYAVPRLPSTMTAVDSVLVFGARDAVFTAAPACGAR